MYKTYIDVIYKNDPHNTKLFLSRHFQRDFSVVSKNVLITSNNPTITKSLCDIYECTQEKQPIIIARALSTTMRMDLMVLNNAYCDRVNKKEYWDVFYYRAVDIPPSEFKKVLESDSEDEEL